MANIDTLSVLRFTPRDPDPTCCSAEKVTKQATGRPALAADVRHRYTCSKTGKSECRDFPLLNQPLRFLRTPGT